MVNPAEPRLCYVTDRSQLPPDLALDSAVRRAISAGVDLVQFREKDLPARQLREFVHQAVEAAHGSPTRIVVNDRLDVAIAAGAAGVHLGGQSLPAREVVGWLARRNAPPRNEFLVGVSCHSLDEARQAEQAGADYVFFGPVFETPSKLSFGPPQGVARLAEVCRTCRVPVYAIGGITIEYAAECLRAGAAGLAAIRLFQQPADLADVVRRLRLS